MVESALRADFANILKAGYNARYTLIGPEVDHKVLEDELKGTRWHAAGVGFGVRGSNSEELTAEFESKSLPMMDEVGYVGSRAKELRLRRKRDRSFDSGRIRQPRERIMDG